MGQRKEEQTKEKREVWPVQRERQSKEGLYPWSTHTMVHVEMGTQQGTKEQLTVDISGQTLKKVTPEGKKFKCGMPTHEQSERELYVGVPINVFLFYLYLSHTI